VDIAGVDDESLLDQMAVVSQEPKLFNTSIAKNIQYRTC